LSADGHGNARPLLSWLMSGDQLHSFLSIKAGSTAGKRPGASIGAAIVAPFGPVSVSKLARMAANLCRRQIRLGVVNQRTLAVVVVGY
jgi:hypothetical protein